VRHLLRTSGIGELAEPTSTDLGSLSSHLRSSSNSSPGTSTSRPTRIECSSKSSKSRLSLRSTLIRLMWVLHALSVLRSTRPHTTSRPVFSFAVQMGRSDTLKNADAASSMSKGSQMPRIFAKKALKGLRSAASNSANMLGNVASEMAGSSVLQPNSPQSMVTASLSSANKTRMVSLLLSRKADSRPLSSPNPSFLSFSARSKDLLLFPTREAGGRDRGYRSSLPYHGHRQRSLRGARRGRQRRSDSRW